MAALRLAPRVEERDGRLLEAQRRLQEERQRSVVLEQHLGRMHLEPRRRASQRSASGSKTGRAGPGARVGAGKPGGQRRSRSAARRGECGKQRLHQGGVCPSLLPPVLFPRPPRQTQEPQSAFATGGPGPAQRKVAVPWLDVLSHHPSPQPPVLS